MNAIPDPASNSSLPSGASRAMIERLIGFNTVSRDSNLGLIEWVRDYLHGLGAVTRLTYDPTGKKANLFATLGESQKPGLILSGHSDVVPVDGQNWDTDPFSAVEPDMSRASCVSHPRETAWLVRQAASSTPANQ